MFYHSDAMEKNSLHPGQNIDKKIDVLIQQIALRKKERYNHVFKDIITKYQAKDNDDVFDLSSLKVIKGLRRKRQTVLNRKNNKLSRSVEEDRLWRQLHETVMSLQDDDDGSIFGEEEEKVQQHENSLIECFHNISMVQKNKTSVVPKKRPSCGRKLSFLYVTKRSQVSMKHSSSYSIGNNKSQLFRRPNNWCYLSKVSPPKKEKLYNADLIDISAERRDITCNKEELWFQKAANSPNTMYSSTHRSESPGKPNDSRARRQNTISSETLPVLSEDRNNSDGKHTTSDDSSSISACLSSTKDTLHNRDCELVKRFLNLRESRSILDDDCSSVKKKHNTHRKTSSNDGTPAKCLSSTKEVLPEKELISNKRSLNFSENYSSSDDECSFSLLKTHNTPAKSMKNALSSDKTFTINLSSTKDSLQKKDLKSGKSSLNLSGSNDECSTSLLKSHDTLGNSMRKAPSNDETFIKCLSNAKDALQKTEELISDKRSLNLSENLSSSDNVCSFSIIRSHCTPEKTMRKAASSVKESTLPTSSSSTKNRLQKKDLNINKKPAYMFHNVESISNSESLTDTVKQTQCSVQKTKPFITANKEKSPVSMCLFSSEDVVYKTALEIEKNCTRIPHIVESVSNCKIDTDVKRVHSGVVKNHAIKNDTDVNHVKPASPKHLFSTKNTKQKSKLKVDKVPAEEDSVSSCGSSNHITEKPYCITPIKDISKSFIDTDSVKSASWTYTLSAKDTVQKNGAKINEITMHLPDETKCASNCKVPADAVDKLQDDTPNVPDSKSSCDIVSKKTVLHMPNTKGTGQKKVIKKDQKSPPARRKTRSFYKQSSTNIKKLSHGRDKERCAKTPIRSIKKNVPFNPYFIENSLYIPGFEHMLFVPKTSFVTLG